MSVYKKPDSATYLFDFWYARRRHHGTTGCTVKSEARKFEELKREEAKAESKQQADADNPNRPMTIDEACGRYYLQVGMHHPRSDQTEWSLNWLTENLGKDRLIKTITDRDVAELVAKRRGEPVRNAAVSIGRKKRPTKDTPVPKLVAPSTVNRSTTEMLRKVLNRARDVWGQDVVKIKWRQHMLKEPQERIRSLRPEEEAALFAHLPEQLHAIVRFTLRTGCRLSESINLPWSAVDWGDRTLSITGKGDKTATIPMARDVRDLLWGLRGQHEKRVFVYAAGEPMTVSGLDTAFGRAVKRAGIENFRFHDLRHTAATRLLRQSGNIKHAQRLLRHNDIATTSKYAHSFDEDLRRELDEMVTEVPTKIPTETKLKAK